MIRLRESGARRGAHAPRVSGCPLSWSVAGLGLGPRGCGSPGPRSQRAEGSSQASPARAREAGLPWQLSGCKVFLFERVGSAVLSNLLVSRRTPIDFQTASLWEPPHPISLNQVVSLGECKNEKLIFFLLGKNYFICRG